MTFRIEQPRERLRCPVCDSSEVWIHARTPRLFRTLPIGNKPVSIEFNVPRVYCFRAAVRARLIYENPFGR